MVQVDPVAATDIIFQAWADKVHLADPGAHPVEVDGLRAFVCLTVFVGGICSKPVYYVCGHHSLTLGVTQLHIFHVTCSIGLQKFWWSKQIGLETCTWLVSSYQKNTRTKRHIMALLALFIYTFLLKLVAKK